MRPIASAIVTHDPLDEDILGPEPGHGAFQEAGGPGGRLIGQELGIGHTRRVVDAHVQELPPHTS